MSTVLAIILWVQSFAKQIVSPCDTFHLARAAARRSSKPPGDATTSPAFLATPPDHPRQPSPVSSDNIELASVGAAVRLSTWAMSCDTMSTRRSDGATDLPVHCAGVLAQQHDLLIRCRWEAGYIRIQHLLTCCFDRARSSCR